MEEHDTATIDADMAQLLSLLTSGNCEYNAVTIISRAYGVHTGAH
jgi:hypothetical protein